MTPQNHTSVDPDCYRCELSADEAPTIREAPSVRIDDDEAGYLDDLYVADATSVHLEAMGSGEFFLAIYRGDQPRVTVNIRGRKTYAFENGTGSVHEPERRANR